MARPTVSDWNRFEEWVAKVTEPGSFMNLADQL